MVKNLKDKKYTALILSIIGLFFLDPIVEHYTSNFPVTPVMITFIIVGFLYVLGVKKRIVMFNLVTGIIALGVNIYSRLVMHVRPETLPQIVAVPLFILAVLFYAAAIFGILGKVFNEKKVTTDTIWGGIAVYFLFGIFWGVLYNLVMILNPNAFSQPASALESFDLIYFSFITLTTLGYGDISPVSHAAMVLAVIEAVTGQIYLAVFVARLIGLEIGGRSPHE